MKRRREHLIYWVTWLALVVLALASFALSRAVATSSLGVALLIALVKAALILGIFMQIGRGTSTIRFAVLIAVTLVVLLGGLAAADMGAREPSVRER
jgi:caa(3)-type oxidase subunit IV